MVNFGKNEEIEEDAWSLSELFEWWEYLVTPDNFGIWKRHLAWGKIEGDRLLNTVTSRFGSSMVFLSLLLSAQLTLLFNSADVPTSVRHHLSDANYRSVEFYVGLLLVLGSIMTLFALLTTFTAWGMVCSLSKQNALPVLRSSIGQQTTTMPSRLVAESFLIFLAWMVLYLYVLLPKYLAGCFVVFSVFLYLRMVNVYSAFGRLLMHSGAMGDDPIFDTKEEERLKADEFNLRLSMVAVQQATQSSDDEEDVPDGGEEGSDADLTVGGMDDESRRVEDRDEEAPDDAEDDARAQRHRRTVSRDSVGDFSLAEQELLDEWATDQAARRWQHRRRQSGIRRPSRPHRRTRSVPAVLERPPGGRLTRFLSGGSKGKGGVAAADGTTTNVAFGASATLGNVGSDVETRPLTGILTHGGEAGHTDGTPVGHVEVAAGGDSGNISFLANVHKQPSWTRASQDSVLYAVSEGNEVTNASLGEVSAGLSSQKTTGNRSRREETPPPVSNPGLNLVSDDSRPSLTSVPEGTAMEETDHDDSVVPPLGQQTLALNVRSRGTSETPVMIKGDDSNSGLDVHVSSTGHGARGSRPCRIPGSVSLEANLRVSDLSTDQGNGNSILLSDSLVSSTTREPREVEDKDNPPDDSRQVGDERQRLLSTKPPGYQ